MKLSKRLSVIDSLISQQTSIVWDCCCDHGYLGLALLKRQAAKKVIFVDIVPNLMADLELLLTQLSTQLGFNANNPQWQVMCKDAGSISLSEKANQVVVIAGVGGELLLKLVQQIVANNNLKNIQNTRFILCPVHHTYHVRAGLDILGFGLLSEHLICENNRFYEIIEVSLSSSKKLSYTGSTMWDFKDKNHTAYKQKLLNHYNKMLNKDEAYYQKVITDYQGLTDS